MDEPILDDSVPSFTFDPEEIARIRADAGVTDLPPANEPIILDQPPVRTRKRKQGRPRALNPDGTFKYPKPTDYSDGGPENNSEASPLLSPAPLTKRDEREVSTRLVGILTGATGMA